MERNMLRANRESTCCLGNERGFKRTAIQPTAYGVQKIVDESRINLLLMERNRQQAPGEPRVSLLSTKRKKPWRNRESGC